jgi:hypothetical protein
VPFIILDIPAKQQKEDNTASLTHVITIAMNCVLFPFKAFFLSHLPSPGAPVLMETRRHGLQHGNGSKNKSMAAIQEPGIRSFILFQA